MTKDAAIVIPVYNQLEYTRLCLASLASTPVAGAKVVIVDNGSRDGTTEFLATQPGITVIHNAENRGCASAWNQGVKAAERDWVVFLNNDVLVTDGWLEALLEFAEKHELGVASPAMREGKLDYDLPGHARALTRSMCGIARWGTAFGACFLVHQSVFAKVGWFDEQFRIGLFEDTDFFLRVRQAGIRLGITGSSFIHHFGSVTRKAVRRDPAVRPYEQENRAYFRAKWRLGWARRRWQRLQRKIAVARWRWAERLRHGHTLHEKSFTGRLAYH